MTQVKNTDLRTRRIRELERELAEVRADLHNRKEMQQRDNMMYQTQAERWKEHGLMLGELVKRLLDGRERFVEFGHTADFLFKKHGIGKTE